ncbi:MAG: response regulator [Verrucomicrobiia bacterium]|jgi:CheY-like chemotaxis protein
MNEVEILLVEDNPRDAELAMRALQKRNLTNKLVWVKDGAAALEFIFGPRGNADSKVRRRPKVVLLDLKLPKVDGMEVLRQIKANDKAKSIPVVILTSSREEPDIVQSYELGVNSYIVKPVSFDNFSEAVSRLGLYWVLINQPPEHFGGAPSSGSKP